MILTNIDKVKISCKMGLFWIIPFFIFSSIATKDILMKFWVSLVIPFTITWFLYKSISDYSQKIEHGVIEYKSWKSTATAATVFLSLAICLFVGFAGFSRDFGLMIMLCAANTWLSGMIPKVVEFFLKDKEKEFIRKDFSSEKKKDTATDSHKQPEESERERRD